MRKRVVVAGEHLLKWWNLTYVGMSWLFFAAFSVVFMVRNGEEIMMGVTLEAYFTTQAGGIALTEWAVTRLRRIDQPRRLMLALALAPVVLPLAFSPFVALGMLFTWEPIAHFPRAALGLGVLHAIVWEISLLAAWLYWRIQGGRLLPGRPVGMGEAA